MEPMNHVLPGEGPWLTGDASARALEGTGVQVDAVQARLDELLRTIGKSGISDQDFLSNPNLSQRRFAGNCLVDDWSNRTTATT